MKNYITTYQTPDGKKWETEEYQSMLHAKERAGTVALINDWELIGIVEEQDA